VPDPTAPTAEPLQLRVVRDVVLEAELARPPDTPRAAAVLCHPHPQYGGTMRSIVISELFRTLPARGVACLRFNFRGVEGSTGVHGEGRGERADAVAAVDALVAAVPDGIPIVLAGWSFGGDVTLSVHDDRLAAWLAIAPPLRFAEVGPVAADPRPKHLVLAEHDEVRPPEEIAAVAEGWTATTVETVPGASHFFVGRTDAVVAAADRLITRVAR
jgi:hypothetical protein